MPMIDTAQLQPASDAVQAAVQAMSAANNEIAHLELETPRSAEKIRRLEAEKANARQRYELALIDLSDIVHEVLKQASAAE
ncbi:hypothetical protein PBOI14_25310 [Pseudomonas sp. Boi14]|nr:hypothetical protein PBOI14_25310 [Pseudomonas sp. Boi14]